MKARLKYSHSINSVSMEDNISNQYNYRLHAPQWHPGPFQFRRSLLKVLQLLSAIRRSFGRLFHTRDPSCIDDLSPYLVVRAGGTTAELSCLMEYWVCFSAMRYWVKTGDSWMTINFASHAFHSISVQIFGASSTQKVGMGMMCSFYKWNGELFSGCFQVCLCWID